MPGFEGLLTGHTLVGRYTIGPVIGRGGFAAVYEAADERLGRTVAVKVITLAAEGSEAEELRRRFDREARASASLHHPNVVAVYDFGTDPRLGIDFLVMERLTGEDLRARMRRGDPLPVPTALRILRDAADGVDAGHRIGLVHRDLKPGNIFLAQLNRPDWFRVCVVDFGIARIVAGDETTRITHRGTPLSPAYASPEQLRGEDQLTPASDVFSLGVIGYELLGGRRPFAGDRLHPPAGGFAPPVPLRELNPAVPQAVAEAIERAMADEVDARFPDAGAFAAALGRAEAEMGAAPPLAGDAGSAEPLPSPLPIALAPSAVDEPELPVPPLMPVQAVAEGRSAEVESVGSGEPTAASGELAIRPPDPSALADDAAPALPVMRTQPPPPPPTRAQSPAPASSNAGETRPARRRSVLPLAIAVVAVLAAVALWFGLRGSGGRTAVGGAMADAGRRADSTVHGDTGSSQRTGTAEPPASGDAADAGSPAGRAVARGAGVAPGVAAPTSARDEPVVAAPVAATAPAAVPPAPAAAAPASPVDAARAAAVNREGQAMFERGDVPGAVQRFRQAARMAPASAAYRNNLAWALFQAGDADGAAAELAETLRLDPRRAIAYANLGELRAARGDRAGAVAAYRRFLELNTDAHREQVARGKLRKLGGD